MRWCTKNDKYELCNKQTNIQKKATDNVFWQQNRANHHMMEHTHITLIVVVVLRGVIMYAMSALEGAVYRVYTVWELQPAILPAAPTTCRLPLPSSQLPAPSSSLQIISPLCCHNCSHPPTHLLTTRWTFTSPTATMPYDVEEEVKKVI